MVYASDMDAGQWTRPGGSLQFEQHCRHDRLLSQTALCATMDFTKTFRIEYERKYLNVPDGGQICIDITPPLRDIPPDNRPILVCAHGLTGGSHESVSQESRRQWTILSPVKYIRSVLAVLTKPVDDGGHGWRAVVVNSRGCANGPLKTAKLYKCVRTNYYFCDASLQ